MTIRHPLCFHNVAKIRVGVSRSGQVGSGEFWWQNVTLISPEGEELVLELYTSGLKPAELILESSP